MRLVATIGKNLKAIAFKEPWSEIIDGKKSVGGGGIVQHRTENSVALRMALLRPKLGINISLLAALGWVGHCNNRGKVARMLRL